MSTDYPARPKPRHTVPIALAITGALVAGILLVRIVMNEQPPETPYDQAGAYEHLERAVEEVADVLPDFPGFFSRVWQDMPCSRRGVDNPDYVNIEISYTFDEELWDDPLVRETYLSVLRQHWTTLGYDVYRDDERSSPGQRTDHTLLAQRGDGIRLRYRVAGTVSLAVQSGCVPVSDRDDIPYVPPTGGVAPGSQGDTVSRRYSESYERYIEASPDAVNPFDD